MSSRRSSSMEARDNIRKRVCKACDRCRLKKSKCDGASPCSRCKADNAICVFGERKKSQDKVYPKGYVEMLEQQQSQLVTGLRELYTRLQRGQGWPGQPLPESSSGHPLTHDILERLDLLQTPNDHNSVHEGFEEDCHRMQQKLLEGGATFTHRRGSVSSDSEHGRPSISPSYSDTPVTTQLLFRDPFTRNHAPPTPPMNSPFPRQSQAASPISRIKQESPTTPSTFVNTNTLDPLPLSRATWLNDSIMMDEPIDFSKPMYGFENFNYDHAAMIEPMAMHPSDPIMPDWNSMTDLDFSNFIQNPVGA
ncbi:hypothetical protein P153DRAFT_366246 [Dothidotthia symphoricarpi CBS 119687]|uniref:Zn(2)-C6 fungal-type domain-containing protein n=1 Tax=Dothidotthia symphoricarpi CBS 119687 TaxID=1392245 RepID=A0A6A6ACW3_9PLEO|nr:uncharacterized protein P153DRAFT_366246 [Dothidotthia symphoricarpi CBS 119687]KAF2129742.1 hypothetical protein P153DRAFT_366246 [Dothidotthia symphoricarpi CBS 119687]